MNRDRILEQALKQELRSANSPITAGPAHRGLSEGGCLDAETLAAWTDGALDALQTALAETHLSSCARCQMMVGALARSTSAASPAADRTGVRLWRWWLMPMAAATAAVTLWIVVPQQQREIATAPATPAPAAAVDAVGQASPAVAPAERAPLEARKQAAREKGTERVPSAVSEAAAPRRDENRLADTAAAPQIEAASQERKARAAAPPPVAAAPPGAPVISGLRRSELAFAPVEIVSPIPAQRWRATQAGIERSEDGGATWTMVRPSSGEAIVAGSSPAAAICWLVGHAGVVLVTTDARTFVRVEVPGRDDLVAVTAADARTAAVTTASGRTLRTQDGGASWR